MYASMLLLSASAFASNPISIPEPPSLQEAVRAGDDGVKRRAFTQEVNIRGGWANVPASLLDIWYFDADDDNGQHLPRPKAHAYAIGLEYVIRNDVANGIFYFEYMPALMEGGYWDDREGDPPDYDDGDWVQPNHLALINFGANYAFEVKVQPWFSLLFGGGLGIAFRTGSIDYWSGDGPVLPWDAYEANPDEPEGSYDIPSVLPLIDIQAGMRFTISEQANIRLYGGLHDLIFIGASAGVVF